MMSYIVDDANNLAKDEGYSYEDKDKDKHESQYMILTMHVRQQVVGNELPKF